VAQSGSVHKFVPSSLMIPPVKTPMSLGKKGVLTVLL
jgi:hypothetical protein